VPYVLDEAGTAIIVAADVIGVATLADHELDPLAATSRGLAQPILAAQAAGASRVIIFIGGVATVDGGLGLISALGGTVKSIDGLPLGGVGGDLLAVRHLDLRPALQRISNVELLVATDVSSPLYGADGAAHVFGPQKGADRATVLLLDRGLEHLAGYLGDVAGRPGAGAAGGLGAALMALGATRVSGADTLLELTNFRSRIRGVDLCLTGEGKVDRGTAAGKAAAAVITACQEESVPCAVLGGTLTHDAEDLYPLGTAGVFAIGRKPQALTRALEETAEDLERTTRAVCSFAEAVRVHASLTGTGDRPPPGAGSQSEALFQLCGGS
jgi:glycerate kinase